jgi:hypothetical protein
MTYLRDRMIRAVLTGSLTWIVFGAPTLAGERHGSAPPTPLVGEVELNH